MNTASKLCLVIFCGFLLFYLGVYYHVSGCNPQIANCYDRIKYGTLVLIYNVTCNNDIDYIVMKFTYNNNSCTCNPNELYKNDFPKNNCTKNTINEINLLNDIYKIDNKYDIILDDSNFCSLNLYKYYNTWLIGIIMSVLGSIIIIYGLIHRMALCFVSRGKYYI